MFIKFYLNFVSSKYNSEKFTKLNDILLIHKKTNYKKCNNYLKCRLIFLMENLFNKGHSF